MGVPALSSVEVQTNPNEESPVRGTGLWALKESKDPLPNRCSRKKKNSIREVKDGVIRRPNVKRKQVMKIPVLEADDSREEILEMAW